MNLTRTLALATVAIAVTATVGFSQAPAQDGDDTGLPPYRLGPSDVLTVWVFQEADLTLSAIVRPDGKITLPFINDVEVVGRTADEVRAEVTDRLRAYVDDPVVTIAISGINYPKFGILGEVNRPGQYPLPHRMTVLDAIAVAGGLTTFADKDSVYILRDGPDGLIRKRVNVEEFLDDGRGAPPALLAGDMVYVR